MATSPPLVLVVDDHEPGRFAKVQFVRRAGYRVLETATGGEAVRLGRTEQPDVVLLDVNLPDISGIEVCRQLKRGGGTPPAQILQLSSTAISDADRIRGLEGGADAYLTEPVSPEIVLATIEALLRVRRAEMALADAARRERQAREEAERANRFKDEFLATLSHELRTPLNAMVGWIWHLRHAPQDEAGRERALDGLERSTALQARLINDLFDVSRINRGKIDLDLGRVDLERVVTSAVEAAEPAARARGVRLDPSTAPAIVLGDPARLHQIVMNLLTNAIQFSSEGEVIHVTLATDGSEAALRVRDEGQGIEPALLPHVFDAFRQGETGSTRRHGGLGLGLAIVQQLVGLHGGTVEAHSEGRGQGATFTVRLPTSLSPDTTPDDRPDRTGRELADRRIVIVDDDEDSLFWLGSLVTSAGATARTVGTVHDALEALAADRCDLLLSDIGMPDHDGLELVREVRRRGWAMPAVAVTAFASPDERSRILAAGYDVYVTKPISPETFVATLAAILRARGE
jgi:signal transduction histidine kinase